MKPVVYLENVRNINPAFTHQHQIDCALQALRSNLSPANIYMIHDFLVKQITAPETLSTMQRADLLEIWNSINAELIYRHEEKRA